MKVFIGIHCDGGRGKNLSVQVDFIVLDQGVSCQKTMNLLMFKLEGDDVGPILGRAHGMVLSLWDEIFV